MLEQMKGSEFRMNADVSVAVTAVLQKFLTTIMTRIAEELLLKSGSIIQYMILRD